MWPLHGCSSRDLSTQLRAAAPAQSCFGGLIRSLPDSLPRVVARYWPASKCSSGPTPVRRRLSEGTQSHAYRRRGIHVCHRSRHPCRHPLISAGHRHDRRSGGSGGVPEHAARTRPCTELDHPENRRAFSAGRHRGCRFLRCRSCPARHRSQACWSPNRPRCRPAARRGVGKTDALDAVRIARSVFADDTSRLRRPRATGQRVVLRVLEGAREQMVAERTRAINALTALLRTIDLGIDMRKALSHSQFKVIAGGVTVGRTPLSAPAGRRLSGWQAHRRPRCQAGRQPQGARCRRRRRRPELCELPGVGSVVAACVLTASSHPGRVRSEAAFAALAGTCPIPASSGNTLRHRLNRGGDRRLNRALTTVVIVRHAHPRTNPRLRCPTSRGRPHHQGDHALPQALHHPTALPDPRRSASDPRNPLRRYRSIPVQFAKVR